MTVPAARGGARLLSFLPVAACFFTAFWHMRYDWLYDEACHYCWLVPVLALYLFSVRWRDRPPPAPGQEGKRLAGWMLIAAVLPLAWLFREANPEWRLLGVIFAVIAMGAALLYLREMGGRAWVRHFTGPVLFFLAAVPWPSVLEKTVTGALMPLNARIALEGLHWMGIPASLRGTLISLPHGTLGVEEACSGIRSLQTTIMAAWFIGELNLLKRMARLGLLAAGVGVAFLTNVLRTLFLGFCAARGGLEAARSWHDTAGLVVLGANAAFILFLGMRLARRNGRSAPVGPPAPVRLTPGIPWRGPAICAAGLILMFPLTGWWYGSRETEAGPDWYLAAPVTAPSFREVPIDDRTAIMLRYTKGWSAKWQAPGGQPLHGFYFEWGPGRVPPENMNVHRPGGCLANLGIHLVKELAPIEVPLGREVLKSRFLLFDDGGHPLYLIYLVSETHQSGDTSHGPFDFTYGNRFQSVIRGRRNPGQRFIETGLWNAPSEDEARTVFTGLLTQWLRVESDPEKAKKKATRQNRMALQ